LRFDQLVDDSSASQANLRAQLISAHHAVVQYGDKPAAVVQKNAVDASAQLADRWARGQEEIAAARAAAGTAGHFMGMEESEARCEPDWSAEAAAGLAGLVKVSEMVTLTETACLSGCNAVLTAEESKDALAGWAATVEGVDFSWGRRLRVNPPVLALRRNAYVATARLSEAKGTRLKFEVAITSGGAVVAKGVVRVALVEPQKLLVKSLDAATERVVQVAGNQDSETMPETTGGGA
jgi:hypothetical protein